MRKIKLLIKWSKKEKDFIVYFPTKASGNFFLEILKPWKNLRLKGVSQLNKNESVYYQDSHNNFQIIQEDWLKELKDRGFDPKTFKAEISIDLSQLKEKFPHIYDNLSEKEKQKLGFKEDNIGKNN